MNQEIKQNNQISENPRKVAKRIQENKKDFLETFRECAGIITIACQKKGISRATFYNWLSGDKEFKKEVEEIKKEQIGIVEDRLLKAILADELSAIIFYLKSKHPEYKPRAEVSLESKAKVDQALDKIKDLLDS